MRVGQARSVQARRLVLFPREDGDGDRSLNAFDVEETAFVLPIESRCGDAGVGQPLECDVVEDLIAGELAGSARSPVQRRIDGGCWLTVAIAVIEKPGGEARG